MSRFVKSFFTELYNENRVFQAIINIAVVTGTIPVTGMLLPFFSYGGSSLVVNLVAVGLLLGVSRSE